MHGSGSLIRWLLDNQLVDEIILLTYPVVIGQGTRLFPETGPDTALGLADSRATPSGVTIGVYRRPAAQVCNGHGPNSQGRLKHGDVTKEGDGGGLRAGTGVDPGL